MLVGGYGHLSPPPHRNVIFCVWRVEFGHPFLVFFVTLSMAASADTMCQCHTANSRVCTGIHKTHNRHFQIA